MLKNFIFLIIITIAIPIYAVPTLKAVSPWEHSGDELATSPVIVPSTAPITYTEAFTREREMFGYKPRFMPGTVTFDKNNRPYILTPVHTSNEYDGNASAFEASFVTEIAYLQTLDDSGDWTAYDVSQMFVDLYNISSYVSPQICTGFAYEDRVAFDNDNTFYFTFYQTVGFSGKTVIYSTDGLTTVQKLGLTNNYLATLEAFDTFLSSERCAPTISSCAGTGPIKVTDLKKDALGNLRFAAEVEVSPAGGMISPNHTGYLNHTVTVGDVVHCVWLDSQDQETQYYTKQYYTSYNRTTGEVSTPYLLGSTYGYWPTGSQPADIHNGPTITVDRDKVLHVVLGGHSSQMKYTYSQDGGKSWSTPLDLPGNAANGSYPTLITDRDNTVHLVYRLTSQTGVNPCRLVYARKKEGQSWEDMGELVVPAHDGYSGYYQELTIDRLGRLFLTYWYLAKDLNASDVASYEAKWPDHDPELAHDPVIIMTDNGGDSWRIATTQDFVDGIIDDTVPVAYYRLDATGAQADIAGDSDGLDSIHGNPASVSGQIDAAVCFDGSDDGLAGEFDQAGLLPDGAFTLVGWFKVDTLSSSTTKLIHAVDAANNGFELYMENGKWVAGTSSESNSSSLASIASITTSEWTHVAVTFFPSALPDATGTYTGTLKIYVDGQLDATGLDKKYKPSDASSIALAMSLAGDNYSACCIDDFAIFSGAMPQQKVTELATLKYSPFNVSRELLRESDFNEDGIVNIDDLLVVLENWLK